MKPRHQDRGFSIMELMLSMSILAVLLGMAFGAFYLSTRIFQDTSTRQSAESQLKTIKILAERDIELTNFWNVGLVDIGRDVATNPRHAFAVTAIKDWNAPGSYLASTGRPNWDRHVVWYATQEPEGRLVRQLVDPQLAAGQQLDSPLNLAAATLSDTDPFSNPNTLSTKILSRDILSFRVNPNAQNGTVELSVRLQARGLKRQLSSEQTQENLEVSFVIQPRNTWPPI